MSNKFESMRDYIDVAHSMLSHSISCLVNELEKMPPEARQGAMAANYHANLAYFFERMEAATAEGRTLQEFIAEQRQLTLEALKNALPYLNEIHQAAGFKKGLKRHG